MSEKNKVIARASTSGGRAAPRTGGADKPTQPPPSPPAQQLAAEQARGEVAASRNAPSEKEPPMVGHALLRARIASELSAIPCNDRLMVAFHAAYALSCERSYLAEARLGPGTRDSIHAALSIALQDRNPGGHLPPNVEMRLKVKPTEEFCSRLSHAAHGVADRVLDVFAKIAAPLDLTTEDLRRLVRECLWNYVARAENLDVF